MPHNRYYITRYYDPEIGAATLLGLESMPSVSVDKVTARIKVARPCRILGGDLKGKFKPNYQWWNVDEGKLGVWANGLRDEVFVTFNPAMLDRGHNLSPYRGDVLESLQSILPDLQRCYRDFPLTRREMTQLRAGLSELSEIHLAADFEFPSLTAIRNCMRELKLRWGWPWTRRRNLNYETSLYLNQRHWNFVAYMKDEEIAVNHADWPNSIKSRCNNRLRLEIRLRRQELLKLARRLLRVNSDLPLVQLSRTGDWEPEVYPRAFDFYASRLRPIGRKPHTLKTRDVPLFGLMRYHKGRPVYPR